MIYSQNKNSSNNLIMKRLIFSLLFVSTIFISSAQDKSEHLSFKGVPVSYTHLPHRFDAARYGGRGDVLPADRGVGNGQRRNDYSVAHLPDALFHLLPRRRAQYAAATASPLACLLYTSPAPMIKSLHI